MNLRKMLACSVSAVLLCAPIVGTSSCLAEDYNDYAASYNSVTANGGLDTTIEYSVTMGDAAVSGTATLKMSVPQDSMIFELTTNDGTKITQFTDGQYLYSDDGTTKTKVSIAGDEDTSEAEEPSEETETAPDASESGEPERTSDDAPTFDTSSFVSQFASFMEVSKIQEMGLLNALPSAIVDKVAYKDGTYSLDVNTDVISLLLLDTEDGNGTSEVPTVSNIKDFTYTVTTSNYVVNGLTMSGSVDVSVPGSLMSDGNAANYTMTFTVKVTFNNPGEAVTVTLPSTDGFVG